MAPARSPEIQQKLLDDVEAAASAISGISAKFVNVGQGLKRIDALGFGSHFLMTWPAYHNVCVR